LGEMRLETGKYLRLDAALVERIRMTPGRTVPPVSFTVATCGGLGVRSEGAGARSERSRCVHGHTGAEEEWPGGPGCPRVELVK
jgi:hypothetical protein